MSSRRTAEDVEPGAASVRRTLTLVRGRRGRLSVATLLGAATVGAGIGLLTTSAWLISRASQQPSIAALGVAVVGVRFFALSRGLFRYGERLVGHDAAFRSLADLRVTVYERLERLAPAGLPAFRRGDLLARVVDDVDRLQDLTLRVLPPYGIAVLVGVGTVLLVAWLLPAAAAVLVVTLGLAGAAVPWLSRRIARRSELRQAEVRGMLADEVVDLLEGAPELVAYGAASARVGRIACVDAELTGIATAAARTAGVGAGLVALLAGLALWGSALVGVAAVGADHLDGVLLAVVVLVPLAAFELVTPLPPAAQAFEQVRVSAGRVFAVVDAPPPVVDPPAPARAPAPPCTLRLRDVGARYHQGPLAAPTALDGIDLELRPGRRVAIVGPSGAGKSTLARVLLRFLPYTGSVTLDGVELASIRGDDVRRLIGMAEQDAHVFDTTLRENLLLARHDAGEDALRDTLARARLLDWVDGLPDGLDTPVGTHGSRLSGGQRQRLAVARAILADFPILVLDEPGEHLDLATADALTADLLAATSDRSTLLITHRLAGLEEMDEVLVLDHGRIVERGTFAQLWDLDGHVARLRRRELGT